MNNLKLIIPILCMFPLSVYGSGSPADILGGQFRIFKERIIKRSIDQTEAQKVFTQLTNAIPAQKLNSYQGIIDQTINEAKRRGIFLTIKGMPVSAKASSDTPAPTQTQAKQQELTPAPKIAVTPEAPLQKEPITLQTLTQAPKTTVTPETPLQEKLKTIQFTPLTDAQLNEIKNKLAKLQNSYKRISIEEIERAITQIKKNLGAATIPADIQEIIEKITRFKEKIILQVQRLKDLGAELEQKTIPTLRNTLGDAKGFKKVIHEINRIELDINEIKAKYALNHDMQKNAYIALRNVRNAVYAILKESMKLASQQNDNSVIHKLIQKYMHLANRYPSVSEKHIEKLMIADRQEALQDELQHIELLMKQKKETARVKEIEAAEKEKYDALTNELNKLRAELNLKKQQEDNAAPLNTLLEKDLYTKLPPQEVDVKLLVIDPEMLSEPDQDSYYRIAEYQDFAFDELDSLTIFDEKIKDIQQFATQKITDADLIGDYLTNAERLQGNLKDKFIHAKSVAPQSWLSQEINKRIEQLEPLIIKLNDAWTSLALYATTPIVETTQLQSTPQSLSIMSTLETDTVFDALVKESQAYIDKKTYTLDTVSPLFKNLYKIERTHRDALKVAEQKKDTAVIQKLETRIKKLDTVTEALAAIEEKLDKEEDLFDFSAITQKFEKEHPEITNPSQTLNLEDVGFKGDVKFPKKVNPVQSPLDTKKLPASPGYGKIKTEAEESTQRLLELGEQRRQQEAFEAQQKYEESQRQKNLIRSDL